MAQVRVSTGNGDVDVAGAKASVRVTTGNGDVDVTTAEGPVDVRSGNGDIDVKISALRAKEDMAFHTGSGSVRLTLPANYNGELDATTGNGSIRSDFDLKVKGQLSPRRVRATIGEGGPMLRMSTGNGEFEIRRGERAGQCAGEWRRRIDTPSLRRAHRDRLSRVPFRVSVIQDTSRQAAISPSGTHTGRPPRSALMHWKRAGGNPLTPISSESPVRTETFSPSSSTASSKESLSTTPAWRTDSGPS